MWQSSSPAQPLNKSSRRITLHTQCTCIILVFVIAILNVRMVMKSIFTVEVKKMKQAWESTVKRLFADDLHVFPNDFEGYTQRGYTVRMNTFRRNGMLREAVKHLANCPYVEEIQIIWSDQENEPPPSDFFKLPKHVDFLYLDENEPDAISFAKHTDSARHNSSITTALLQSMEDQKFTGEGSAKMHQSLRGVPANPSPRASSSSSHALPHEERPKLDRVVIERHRTDTLNNRFKPLIPIRTPATLSIDDDLLISCRDLSFAFETWRASPHSMVGFAPRLHEYLPQTRSYKYRGWVAVWWTGYYSFVLTKDCFIPTVHLNTYLSRAPQEVVSFVDRERNCEDLAMSFHVANATGGAPAVWVNGHVQDRGNFNGISGSGGSSKHFQHRSNCLTRLGQLYNGIPFPFTNQRAMRAKDIWSW